MKAQKRISMGLIVALSIISCKKGTNPDKAIAQAPDIYLAGNTTSSFVTGNSISTYTVATYWKNGIATHLTHDSTNASANAIVFNGSDMYVAGFTTAATNTATYWKNGKPTYLNGGNFFASYANSIAVQGNDIYVAGYAFTLKGSQSQEFATYWKNGVPVTLPPGAVILSIAVQGADVYVAGFFYSSGGSGNSMATYWKNGQAVNLTDGTSDADAFAILLNGPDIYVAGNINNLATYWKNGVAVPLGANSVNPVSAYAIAVQGADIYMAGTINTLNAAPFHFPTSFIYWKNGVSGKTFGNISPSTFSISCAIALNGNDVYIAENGENAGYWKNGNLISITPDSTAYFNAIAVVPH